MREEIRQLERGKRMFDLTKRRDVLEKEKVVHDTGWSPPAELGGAAVVPGQDAGHSHYGEVSRRIKRRCVSCR